MLNKADLDRLPQDEKNDLLLKAAHAGDALACDNLIKSGANVECRDGDGSTPLMLAAQEGHTQACLKLIEYQAKVDALSTGWENTALHYAAQHGKTETCLALLDHGADMNLENDIGWTALNAASQNKHDDICYTLIERGASTARIIQQDQTALLIRAAKAGRKKVLENLVEGNADEVAAIESVAQEGDTQACLLLVECAPTQFRKLIVQGAALSTAAASGNIQTCLALIDAGADLKAALITVAESGNTAMCLTLIDRAPEDEKAKLRQVAMMKAAAKGKTQTCLDFIERGAVVNGKDEQGRTALFSALAYPETCEALLQAGAAIDVTDNKGNTPLMYGASLGNLRACFTLIDKGANVNAKNNDGLTVLQMVDEGNGILPQALLDKGADPRGLSIKNFSALLLEALKFGDSQLFQKWLKLAEELHLQIDTTTLLTFAIGFAEEDIISLLLNNDNILVSADALNASRNLPLETVARLLPNLSIDGSITLKSLLTPQALKAMCDPAQVEDYLDALLAYKDNLRQYISRLPLESIAHKDVLIAWDIQDAYARVKKFEDSYKDNSETAMSPREMSAAKTAYEVAQNLYTQAFEERCEQNDNNEHKAIESIEKEIRDMLLDKLSAEGDENTKAFIKQNRDTLSLGQDETLMKQASHRFNATDNTLHIAWRAYDKYAPTTGWINLFTPPTVTSHQYGAGEQSTEEISWDVRKRAAFYFLALKDKTYAIDNQEDREGFFIGEIAEIRRAHNEADQDQDNPSCYPGTIGRIGKMGRGHSQLAVVNPIEQIPIFVQGLLFEKVKDFMQGKDKATQARMIYALSAFTVSTIDDTLAGKNILAAFDVTQEELQEVARLHNEIIASIGNTDEIFNQLNEFFKNSNPPIRALVEQEKIYVQRQLSDIAYKGVGPTVAQQFRQEKITNPYSQETPRVSMQDFIRPLQQLKQKHQLSFNVMEIAKLCSQNNDEQAIDKCELNGEQRQDFEACLQTVRAKVPALQQKLDEKRELWQELYEALRNAKTQVNSQSLKAIVDEMVDHGKDIKKAFKKYNISLPENTVDKTPFDTMSKAERRKSLQLSKSDSEKPLTQAVDMPPKVKKGKRPS